MQQSDFREAPDWDIGESRSSDLYRISSNTASTVDVDPKMELERSYKTYRPEEKDSYVSEVCAYVSKGQELVKDLCQQLLLLMIIHYLQRQYKYQLQ